MPPSLPNPGLSCFYRQGDLEKEVVGSPFYSKSAYFTSLFLSVAPLHALRAG